VSALLDSVTEVVDLVLPRRCAACRRPGALICARCQPGERVHVAVDGVFAAARYEGAVRTAVLAYKERGRRELAVPLADLLARAVAEIPQRGAAVLVPVPSARTVAATRGGDHVARLALRAARRSRLRAAPNTLALTRAVRDSSGLGIQARATNMSGAMRARPAPFGATAVLVDDIVTTGATLREARRALTEAGWTVAGAAVVAATPRRSFCSIGSTQSDGLASVRPNREGVSQPDHAGADYPPRVGRAP
jgi:predicted amidophosphoribosyltransferase